MLVLCLVLATAAEGHPQVLVAGGEHGCALWPDHTAVCWESGQATFAVPSSRFIRLSAGFAHTCGLRSDGRLICWGDNRFGQADAPGGAFTEVGAGDSHTCALRPEGQVEC